MVYILYRRHSDYNAKSYDGVHCTMCGVFERQEEAFSLLIAQAEKKRDELIAAKGEENVYFTYDGEGYYELLDAEVGKYEWFVVPTNMNTAIEEELS